MLSARQASSATAGTSQACHVGSSASRASHAHRTARRVAARSTVSEFEQGVRPPPPPPPPPPPMQTRRGFLSYIGYAGAAAAGGALGFLAGGKSSSTSLPTGALAASDIKEIDELRSEAQFRREYDGHVWVQARGGEWWEVRLDAQVPGTLLLRDDRGYVNFITLNLQQIDLTDDYVVIALFGDGSWEQQVQRVQVRDDANNIVDAQLTQEAFRDLISVMA